jgi:hypothetical protein
MNCFQKKKKCCICYEEKDIIIKCKYCIEGSICLECYNNLSKYGQDKKCPCCRQDDWSNSIANKTKVYPRVEEREVEEIDLEEGLERPNKLCESSNCYKNITYSVRNILYIVKAVWIVFCLWLLGLFSMFMVGAISPENEGNVLTNTILPIFVGLIEIMLIMCCCCNTDCRLGFIQAMCYTRS